MPGQPLGADDEHGGQPEQRPKDQQGNPDVARAVVDFLARRVEGHTGILRGDRPGTGTPEEAEHQHEEEGTTVDVETGEHTYPFAGSKGLVRYCPWLFRPSTASSP